MGSSPNGLKPLHFNKKQFGDFWPDEALKPLGGGIA
jgi:hypothetical protein